MVELEVVELLRFLLGVMERIRNEYIRGATQVECLEIKLGVRLR